MTGRAFAPLFSSRVVRCTASGATTPKAFVPAPILSFILPNASHVTNAFAFVPKARALLWMERACSDRDRCTACGLCAEQCFAGAMTLVGREITVEALMEEVLSDRAFYEQSSGGVTLSGGEPMLQPEFAREVLMRCKEAGIHTAIETAGNYPWHFVEPALPYIDLIMMDLKHMDDSKHRWATSVSNSRLLETARRFALTNKPILFRTPIIPTVNDQNEEVAAIAQHVNWLIDTRKRAGNPAPICYELLPFHQLAGDKYRSLGLDHRAAELKPLSKARMHELNEIACLHSQV